MMNSSITGYIQGFPFNNVLLTCIPIGFLRGKGKHRGMGNAHKHLWKCVLDVNVIHCQCVSGKWVEN